MSCEIWIGTIGMRIRLGKLWQKAPGTFHGKILASFLMTAQ